VKSKFTTGALFVLVSGIIVAQGLEVSGCVNDPQGKPVVGAAVNLLIHGRATQDDIGVTTSGDQGQFRFAGLIPSVYTVRAESPGFVEATRDFTIAAGQSAVADRQFMQVAQQHQSVVISVTTLEPTIDLRNAEVFNRTLFTRDDQVLQQLNAGINAGQHEGGGKSLEIRRFGFNLDHGGVNGGLKVLVDDVDQNQGTQGHGQGYLGSLKALSPELIQEVSITNGPFSPEYGDFSGLGVVHIRQRESLPDEYTLRLEGGNFNNRGAFLAWSPLSRNTDAYIAYDGSYLDGPFQSPGRYRRDNINANFTRSLGETQKVGMRFIFGRNDFYSSGQLPEDLIASRQLNRFGFIDPSDGGCVKLGTLSAYYSKSFASGDTFRADGFIGRSLFDLYSNFTFYLFDPLHGDAFQQHDSRLQEGSNAQYVHLHHLGRSVATLRVGGNFHDNQINVGLYPRDGRNPIGVTTRAHAHVTNEAGYAQESVSLLQGKLLLSAGIRFDEFRYGVLDEVDPTHSGVQFAGRWQGKGSAAFTPSHRVPLTLHANYGRGINSIDARAVVQMPKQPRLATTDFYQAGVSSNKGRISFSADAFLIDHSNEQVYIPDDGTFEFKGPTRAYGFETKTSVAVTRHVSLNAGVTKVANAFYRGGDHRVYVDSAPHFVGSAALTLGAWHGWSGSLRMRAINHYRLHGEDASIVASGHTVLDLGISKQLNHRAELNFSADNLTNRDYWETQNYFESRVTPGAPVIARIHATPGYPLTVAAGITM
jgi:outer membrane receptor protein involved in Fe transport